VPKGCAEGSTSRRTARQSYRQGACEKTENETVRANREYREAVDPAWEAYQVSLAETLIHKKHYDHVSQEATIKLDAALYAEKRRREGAKS